MAKPGPKTKTAASTAQDTDKAAPAKGGKLNASSDGLNAMLEAMNKKYGKNTIRMVDSQSSDAVIDVLSTGSLNLDIALGIGGLPRGRIVEIWGPESSGKTTLTLHIIAEAQKQGLTCAFVDAEHALDLKYAQKLGVDTKKMLITQPDFGEQALDMVEDFCKSGEIGVVVIDSVAALTPKAELEGDMSANHMGLQARMMSRIMRKIASVAAKNNVLVYFINQIRMKIGVMFGCWSYHSQVMLADGTTRKIGALVNNREDVEVLSYNTLTGAIEPKRIKQWFNNGKAERFMRIWTDTAQRGAGHTRGCLPCTPEHTIMTPQGEMSAEHLQVGDLVIGLAECVLSPMQYDVAIGSVLGDGSLRQAGAHNTSLRIGHGEEQVEYCQWKQSLFGDLVGSAGPHTQSDGWAFDLTPSYDMTPVRREAYQGGKRAMSHTVLTALTLRSVAIWYMDDGTWNKPVTMSIGITNGVTPSRGHGKVEISAASYSHKELVALSQVLVNLGLPEPSISATQKRFSWSGEDCAKFQTALAPYIHPSMAYKIKPEYHGQFNSELFTVETVPVRQLGVPVNVIKIEQNHVPAGSMERFDLEIEDNHTYLVSGVAVHNSPETTPGGQALKYAASVRMDIRRIGGVKSGGSETFTGNETKVTVKKNKMAPPFKEALFEIGYGTGIDRVGELLDMGKEHGFFTLQDAARTKSGNTWFYEKAPDADGVCEWVKLATAREAAKAALADMPEIQADVRKRLLDKLLTVKVSATTEADREALAAKIESEKYVPEVESVGSTMLQGSDDDPLAQVAKYAESGE